MAESTVEFIVSLNIKNEEVVRLANEVALLAHETKTEAIRRSLEERREKLVRPPARRRNLRHFLETQIWPFIPAHLLGQPPLTREEEDEILGFGPEGF